MGFFPAARINSILAATGGAIADMTLSMTLRKSVLITEYSLRSTHYRNIWNIPVPNLPET